MDDNKNKIAELLENKSVKIALGVGAVVLIVVSVLLVLNFTKNDDTGNGSNKSTSKSRQSKKNDNENAVKREPKIEIKEELLTDYTLGFSSKDIFNPASLQSAVTTGYASTSSVGTSTISVNTISVHSTPTTTGILPAKPPLQPKSISLTLRKIFSYSGKKYAQITTKKVSIVKDENVTVSETKNYSDGQYIEKSYKIININSSSIILLYGDERIELKVSQTLKKNL